VTHGAPPPLGGDPSRWRLGYRACPCGHTTNLPGCLRWLCFARSPVQSSLGTPHSQGPSPPHWLCFARRPPFATGGLCPRYLTPSIRNPQSKGLQVSRLALFRTIGAICSDAWGTAALGGGPSRGRLGYRACPCGHTTNVPGCLRWLCFARRTTRRLALFHKTVDQAQLQRYRCFLTTREPYGTTLPHTMVIKPYNIDAREGRMLQETLLNANRTGKPLPSKDLTRFNGGGVHDGWHRQAPACRWLVRRVTPSARSEDSVCRGHPISTRLERSQYYGSRRSEAQDGQGGACPTGSIILRSMG